MRNDRRHNSVDSQWALIITDDANFGRELSACWQTRPEVPEFTTVSSEGAEFVGLEDSFGLGGYDLTIVGRVTPKAFRTVVRRAQQTPALLVWVPAGISPEEIREEIPDAMAMREPEDVVEASVTIGAELLRRTLYEQKLARTDRQAVDDRIHAALGRFMIDSRPNFSNALTSVLGTAELMQTGDQRTPERFREDVKTIHMMALRMQSLLQHFSVIEMEMRLKQTRANGHAKDLRLMVGAGTSEGRPQ